MDGPTTPIVRVADALASGQTDGGRVTVQGWVRTRRDSKAGLSFVHVHDGSCFDALQVVAPAALPNYEGEVLRLTAGCAVTVERHAGALAGPGPGRRAAGRCPRGRGLGRRPGHLPHLAQAPHASSTSARSPTCASRTNTIGAVARVRHCLAMAIHRFFDERGFTWIHTPIITAADAEGAGELFRVSTLDLANLPRTADGAIDFSQDFFGRPTFLTVSGQLNVESYCLALTRVYTFGPTFRAENSNTSRHLAEFWMVEPEIAFADLAADADLAEDLLKYVFRAVLDERPDDMAFFAERIDREAVTRLEAFVTSDFVRMTYTEAIDVLQRSGRTFEFPVAWGLALQAEHERYLCEEHAGRPVVVVDYPKEIKAFYMRLNDDERTVAAMDVLAPGIGEIVGGSQREERLDVLDARIVEMGLDPARLRLVPRPAPLRHRAPRRLRPGLRPRPRLRHRHGQHPRRHPLPAHARAAPTSEPRRRGSLVSGCRWPDLGLEVEDGLLAHDDEPIAGPVEVEDEDGHDAQGDDEDGRADEAPPARDAGAVPDHAEREDRASQQEQQDRLGDSGVEARRDPRLMHLDDLGHVVHEEGQQVVGVGLPDERLGDRPELGVDLLGTSHVGLERGVVVRRDPQRGVLAQELPDLLALRRAEVAGLQIGGADGVGLLEDAARAGCRSGRLPCPS